MRYHRCITYREETEKVLAYLQERGCELLTVRLPHGEGDEPFTTIAQAADDLMCCEEGYLILKDHTGRKRWAWFIYGNGVGEVICDYSVNPKINHADDPLSGGPGHAYGLTDRDFQCDDCYVEARP